MSIETDKIKGTLLMLGSVFMYSAMACMIKVASDPEGPFKADSYQMSFIRFLFGLCVLGSLNLTGRIKLKFVNWPLLIARGLIGGTAVWITYLAVEKLGLVKGPLILYTYPVYASIFGVFILKEKLHLVNIAALGFALVGVYLLVAKKVGANPLSDFGKYEIIAVAGAIMAGFTVAIIRKLHQTDTTFEIFFAQCLFGTLLMLVPATMGNHSVGKGLMCLLMGIAAAAIIGQLMMTEGFRYLPVKTASVLSMTELVLNCSIGVLIFREVFTWWSAAGAVLIVTACILSLAGRVNNSN